MIKRGRLGLAAMKSKEEFVFRAEIVVEHGVGDAGRFGYGGGPCAGVAFLQEFFLCRVENLRLRVFGMGCFFIHNSVLFLC